MQLPRFTTRRLMVLVVVVVAAAALGIYVGIERRRARFEQLFQHHLNRYEANSVRVATNANRTAFTIRPSASPRERQLANYHATLVAKYVDAYSYPWLPVPPDPLPPPPE